MRVRLVAVLLAAAATSGVLTQSAVPAGAQGLGPDPAPRVEAAQKTVKAQVALVEQARAALEEGTRTLLATQERSQAVRTQADSTRAAAATAQQESARAREELAAVVLRNFKNPPPSTLSIVLAAGKEGLGEAVLAAHDREVIVGNQRDLLRQADAARVDAEALVVTAGQLEAEAVAAEQEAARQAKALGDLALDYQNKLEASFAVLQKAEADKKAYDAEKARLAEIARQKALAAARKKAAEEAARRAAEEQRTFSVTPTFTETGGATCDGSTDGYPNGFLPASALCSIGNGHRLRKDAAQAFLAMSKAYGGLCVTDSYRSYAAQVDVFRRKPSLAAIPGTSMHGLGIALDLCGGVQRFGSPAHEWMVANAGKYGWWHPFWARQSGSKPEPWHWEYRG